jgi:hypothetical protein
MNRPVLTTDGRNRIHLPKSTGLKGNSYVELEVQKDGTLVLTPVAFVPREAPSRAPRPRKVRPLCMHRTPTGTLCALHAVDGSDFCRIHSKPRPSRGEP